MRNQSVATRDRIGFPLQPTTGEELARTPLRPPDWTSEALCTAYPAEWWYSDEPADQAEAAAICGPCPVRQLCALAALESAEPHGVWGGLTVRARDRIAREEGYRRPGAARHGTRSRYVAGCDDGFGGEPCQPCRRAHADYEHQRRLGKGEAPSERSEYALTRGQGGADTAPAPPLPRPSTADARFLVDVEAAEVGIEDTWRSDETAIELGRMVCRADAAGWSEAELRETLTAAGLSLRQTSVLLTAARAAYGSLPDDRQPARRRTRRRRPRALVSA